MVKGYLQGVKHYGYPDKIIRILENVYKDTFSAVRVNGELTDWFETVVRVLQGCVLSPVFLGIIIDIALDGTEVRAVISNELISDVRFADDIALLAEMQTDCKSRSPKLYRPAVRWGCVQTLPKLKPKFWVKVANSSRYRYMDSK